MESFGGRCRAGAGTLFAGWGRDVISLGRGSGQKARIRAATEEPMNDPTIEYYNKNAEAYGRLTRNADMAAIRDCHAG